MTRILPLVQPTLVESTTIVIFSQSLFFRYFFTVYSVDKYIICLQIKFYGTIEPYIYIVILSIAREEVEGLVPKIMLKF